MNIHDSSPTQPENFVEHGIMIPQEPSPPLLVSRLREKNHIDGTRRIEAPLDSGFTALRKSEASSNEDDSVFIIAVDGACRDLDTSCPRASIGVWFGDWPMETPESIQQRGKFGSRCNISEVVYFSRPTPSKAEIYAATRGLVGVKGLYVEKERDVDDVVVIKTDTPEVYHVARNMDVGNDEGDPERNQLIKELKAAIRELSELGVAVQFWRVGRELNRMADALTKCALNGDTKHYESVFLEWRKTYRLPPPPRCMSPEQKIETISPPRPNRVFDAGGSNAKRLEYVDKRGCVKVRKHSNLSVHNENIVIDVDAMFFRERAGHTSAKVNAWFDRRTKLQNHRTDRSLIRQSLRKKLGLTVEGIGYHATIITLLAVYGALKSDELKTGTVIIKTADRDVFEVITHRVFEYEETEYRSKRSYRGHMNPIEFADEIMKLQETVRDIEELGVQVLFWHVLGQDIAKAHALASLAVFGGVVGYQQALSKWDEWKRSGVADLSLSIRKGRAQLTEEVTEDATCFDVSHFGIDCDEILEIFGN
ncbi:hypothetical protein EG327_002730 [Venturia inaequalis]|uniref:RNase H type-1 domain-containing protein n=1 Tax=Venturia inaequalis TaxID=5025 RepID=A0A8H3VKJ7_VENIN|nr:hypothetical protein EG327_002730 [Venturia inaequalis]